MVYQKDLDIERKWARLMKTLENNMGKRPKDLNAVLFLIGVQELGQGAKNFEKEEKQDLMHIAICKLLSFSGFYELEGVDADGWPHWRNVKPLPRFDLLEQEKLLKMHALDYFTEELGLAIPS
ncbi:hypothetical protein [Marinoscillum furvescens]|uniref:Uncharacterized protein n=1 Tax=Marinoscillum furvescens DSM 4134 TaxID=1122208 RepID=A0A3D9KYE3_MARFU|nr:hypothetical protein [Marinoscillum furvescens]RED94138.1 hypothetical protein C7460_12279 [Marinoscillum furvescens DSM 4134]